MKLRAKPAHWSGTLAGGVMLLDEQNRNCGVFALQPGNFDGEYAKALTNALVKHINSTELEIELPPRLT